MIEYQTRLRLPDIASGGLQAHDMENVSTADACAAARMPRHS